MHEFAFMYVYVYRAYAFMLLDSVLINFICNCVLCKHILHDITKQKNKTKHACIDISIKHKLMYT
jgi:heme exporter protein D